VEEEAALTFSASIKKGKKETQSTSRHRVVDQRKAAIPGASNSAKRILDASFAGSFCKSF